MGVPNIRTKQKNRLLAALKPSDHCIDTRRLCSQGERIVKESCTYVQGDGEAVPTATEEVKSGVREVDHIQVGGPQQSW